MKVYKESADILRLKGKDVTDFLQRVSTNDFSNFEKSTLRRTLFLTEKGRIIDLVTVLNTGSEFIIAPTVNNGKSVSEYLNKYIVTEDIEVNTDRCEKYTLIPEFDNDYEFLGGCNNLENNLFYIDDYRFRKINILVFNEESDFIKVVLEQNEIISESEFKSLAIDKAYLYDKNELNEEVNPLECGLKDYISFKKGCYIGQEVIARLDSQGKIPKIMLKFNSDKEMKTGDKIFFKEANTDTECGFITSTGKSNFDYTALGFIREINLNDEYNYYTNNDVNNIVLINKFKY